MDRQQSHADQGEAEEGHQGKGDAQAVSEGKGRREVERRQDQGGPASFPQPSAEEVVELPGIGLVGGVAGEHGLHRLGEDVQDVEDGEERRHRAVTGRAEQAGHGDVEDEVEGARQVERDQEEGAPPEQTGFFESFKGAPRTGVRTGRQE